MEQMDGKTLNIVEENIEKLKQIFPEVFNENKVDFEKLEEVLGEYKDNGIERYNFTWPGKSKAIRIAQTPSTGTLRPCKEESKNWDETQNLYIEGDNLEVLKLLQKSYSNKVKMIYIDPPYNTGNDFVYKDDFKDNIEHYLKVTGQKDEEGIKATTNTESSGRYHTNWINMMYPRLKLARNLLSCDGVIFITLDDIEIGNLRKICDEIFGEENFLGNIIWQNSIQGKGYGGKFSVQHNNILVYAKSNEFKLGYFERSDEDNKSYSNPDKDPNGLWRMGDVRNALYRPNLIYNIETPSGKIILPPEKGWRWSKETVKEKIKTGEIIFSSDETRIIRKIYLKNQEGKVPETLFLGKNFGTNRIANSELKELFGEKIPFDTPKPTELIKKILELTVTKNDVIMDFFAGSSTVGHSVMKNNAIDNGTRKFILVQIPETTEEKSEAYKLGYKNICEIGKERIRRAGEKIKEENKDKEGIEDLDIGFKVFKLDSSNINKWDAENSENLEQNLLSNIENIKDDRSEEDVLYEVLLKYGIDLNMPIEEHNIKGKKVFDIGFGAIIACLDNNITLDVVEGIGKLKNELEPDTCRVVFMDNGFESDSVKTNAIQILKQYKIDDVKSI